MADLIVKTASERLKKALQERFEPAVDTRVAARMGTGLVAIRGQFVPGAIDADAAAVVNVGRPSAAQYSAANGGTVIIGSNSGGSGSTGVGGATSFSGLTGTIADSQAPQFLKIDGSRMLIGNLDVGPGLTVDGVDISAHAADPNAHHNKQHGIVDPAHHTVTGNQYDVIGLSATNALAVVTTTTDGKTNPNKLLRTDSFGLVQVESLKVDGITSPTSLFLNPTNAVTFLPAKTLNSIGFNGDTFPIGGWSIYPTAISGQNGLTIGYIKADELHVKVFVADETRVDRGEVYISKSYGIISADFTTPSSIGGTVKVYFENSAAISGAIFSNNDWLVVRVVDRSGGGLEVSSIWFQASSYADESATFPLDPNQQSWTLTLRQGVTSYDVKKGNIAIDFGASGQGIIQETVIDASGSPYIKLFTWAGANPYSPANYTTHAKLGKLINADDSTGSMLPTGWGLYTDNAYLNGDFITAGGLVRLYRGDGINIQADILEAGDNTMRLQWWADVESRGGSPITSMVAYEQQIGTQPDSDWTEIITNPIGAVGANVYLAAKDLGGSTYASLRISGASTYNAFSEIVLVADEITLGGTDVYAGGTLHTGAIANGTASTYDIGTVGNPYRTIYVDTVIAGTVGATVPLTGQTWQYDAGDMFIKSDANATRTLYISNPYSGQVMHLDVDGNIAVGGTVDGIDIAAHAANVNAHHAQSHILATTTTLGADHTVSGLTAGMVLKATSGTDAKFVKLLFSELDSTSVTGDILSQYVHISIARTITAIHTFSPGSATAPFTLGTNARGQTVTGLQAEKLARSVIAGNGLTVTGSGLLTADITMTLGTPSTLTVNTTNSVSTTSHTHAITTSNNPGANARILASDSSGGLTLEALDLDNTGTVLTSSAGTLSMGDNTNVLGKVGHAWFGYMGVASYAGFANRAMATSTNYALLQSNVGDTFVNAATGKMVYNRINNADVTMLSDTRLNPAGSGNISLGDYNRKWSELNVVQLMVDNLVASNVMATIGGRIMVAPTAKLTRDIVGSDTTIYLDSNLALPQQELYMAGLDGTTPRVEYMRIVSGPTTVSASEWSYVVTRNIKEQGNLLNTNYGFELGATTNWTTFVDTGASLVSFAVDATSQARGTYSGKVLVGSNGGAHYAGIYTTVTLTAGVTYSVSFSARLSGINGFQADVTGPGGLDTSQANVVGTVGWTRYRYEFDAISTGTHNIRFYENSPASGTFWIDEVIVEAKFGTNGYNWYIGDANVNLGYLTGSGYIDLTSLTTAAGHYGPTISVYSHRTDGGQPKATVSLGNLRSFVDYTADTMGWAVGNDLTFTPTGGFVGMTGDATNGLRLFNVVQKMYTGGAEFLRLDATQGIQILANQTAQSALNAYTFVSTMGGTPWGGLYAFENPATIRQIRLEIDTATLVSDIAISTWSRDPAKTATAYIGATSGVTSPKQATISLSANKNAGTATVDIFGDVALHSGTFATGGSATITGDLIVAGVGTITGSSTSTKGLIINMPTGTSVVSQEWQLNGTQRAYINITSSIGQIGLSPFNNGSGVGPTLVIDRNSNGSTPASGNIRITNRLASDLYFWPDGSSQWRTGASQPTSANDTSGTIIGTQTSTADAKNISDTLPDPMESLRYILDAAQNGLRAWTYKNGEYNNEYFPNGLVLDYAPRYGMDRSESHPQGKSLNTPVAIGDLIAAIAIIHNRLVSIEHKQ